MTEEGRDVIQRAAELAELPSQQLLGYIAAMLEVVVMNQVAIAEVIRNELRDVYVYGTVSIDNWDELGRRF